MAVRGLTDITIWRLEFAKSGKNNLLLTKCADEICLRPNATCHLRPLSKLLLLTLILTPNLNSSIKFKIKELIQNLRPLFGYFFLFCFFDVAILAEINLDFTVRHFVSTT